MKGLYCCTFFLTLSASLFGQSDGDYRTRQSGNWNNATTWEVFNSADWRNLEDASAGAFQGIIPTSSSGSITLQAEFAVTIPTGFSVAIDQTFADIFSELQVSGTLTVADGTGNDLELYNDGIDYSYLTVNNGGTVVLNNLAVIVGTDEGNANFNSGSTYRHNYTNTEGSLPIANWDPNSLVEITGYSLTSNIVATAGGNWSQRFGNFSFNAPLSSSARIFDFAGLLTDIQGQLTVVSTGAGRINLSTNQGLGLDVGSDLEILGTSRVVFNTTGSAVVNVGQDFIFNSTLTAGSNMNSTGSTTINVAQDFLMNAPGGQLTMASGTGSGSGTININRHFQLTAGTITETGSLGSGNFNFVGTTQATFENSGSISGNINFSVANGKRLDLGTSAIAGDGSFTLVGGGTLGVGSPAGLSITSSTGNIQVTGSRTFAATSNIIYNGTSAQSLGNEWGSSGNLNGVAVNLEIANTSTTGVTNNIIGGASLVGNLTLTTGSLNIGNSNTLEIRSNYIRTGGTIGGDATSDLIFSGNGSLASLVFTSGMEFINDLTISRATPLTLGSDATISGNIILSGGNLIFSGHTLTMDGSSIATNGTGLRSTSASSVLIIGGSSFSGTIPFSGTGNQLNKLVFKTNGGTYSWNSTVVVNDSVKLDLGALTHSSGLTMANNSVFVKGGGTITGSSPVVSGADRYNVTYTGEGITGVELPTTASNALNNLVVNSSGTVTLADAIKVNGNLSVTGGTFDSNGAAIEIVGNYTANATSDLTASTTTFSGPSSLISGSNVRFGNLTITGTVSVSAAPEWDIHGDVVNSGSLTVIAGRAVFAGTTTISGSSICNFRSVQIEGILNAPSQMNVEAQFSYINGATFNANGGTVNFTGGPSTFSNVSNIAFHHILISGTVTAPPVLRLTGNFTDNGTFTSGSGTVTFAGSSTQQVGGSTETLFNNITITNAAGPPAVQVVSNKSLRGVLTLSTGTVFDPDGPSGTTVFTLRSTGDVFSPGEINDAAIAALPAGAVVNGNVTVQRFMTLEGGANNSKRIYRYISSPVSNAPVSQLIDNFKISGTFTGSNQAGSQSMFAYNESVITDQNGNGLDINDGYFDFPADNITETMQNGRGYSIFVYGNEIPYTTNGNALWDVRGTINSGEVNFNSFTTLTTSANPATDGWNLVGNPYPSTIDWDAATGWTKTGIANAIYMRDNGVSSPVYSTYINGEGLNGGSRYIPIGQAFQVRATSTPVDFRATETVKVAGQQATYFRERTYDKIRIALEDGSLRDEMLIRFTEAATEGFDPDWDAYKLANYKLNLSSQIESNEKFAINSLPLITCGKTVKLSVTDVPAGAYSLNFSEFETITTDIRIELFDSFTATTIDVRQDTYYSFQVTDDVNSYGDNRFELRFLTKDIPDFIVLGEDVCESSEASIKVTNSEAGVQYRIMKNGTSLTDWQTGTGADLSFTVAGSQLVTGENLLSVQASVQDCEASYVDKQLKLQVVSLTEVTSTTDGSSCGAGKVTISASGATDGNYKWYETETDQVSISGAVNSTFITPELSKTMTYYVSTINALGCESSRKPVVAEVIYFDEVSVTVNEESHTLVSSYESGNQWYYNGAIIQGATGKSLGATETGLYEVEVTINGCISRASREMIVLGNEGDITNGISFYPNPVVNDIMYIELPGTLPAKATVTSSSGQPIGEIDFIYTKTHAKGEFNFAGHAVGLYIISLIQGNTIVHYKIVKK